MTMIILNSIMKPLEKLRLGTEKIKAGDLEYITKYTRDDEFGNIFTDFESMRRELLYSKMEKDKYDRNIENNTLKEKVKELEIKLLEYRAKYGELKSENEESEE